MVSSWKGNESLLRCQRDAVINTVILLVLVEFDIGRIQKKFHQADVAIVADHVVVDDLGHVTVAPVQEAVVAVEAVMSDHTEHVTV